MEESEQQRQQDEQEARKLITEGVTCLVRCGCVNCREDVIRTLLGEGFDITDITGDSITICSPDEPGETLTLHGYIFSSQFQLPLPERGCLAGLDFKKNVRTHRPPTVTQRTVYRWEDRVRDVTFTHIATGAHGFESLCCSEMCAETVEEAEASEDGKVTCPLCKIIWQDCLAFEACDFSDGEPPMPAVIPEVDSIEPAIRGLVIVLNLNDFQTYASRQGQVFPVCRRKPYVAFTAREEAAATLARRLKEDTGSATPRLRWGWEVVPRFNREGGLCYRLQPTRPHRWADRCRRRSLEQDFTALAGFLDND